MNCPNCGKQNPDNSKFCVYCGKSLEENSAPQNCTYQNVQPEFVSKTKLEFALPTIIVLGLAFLLTIAQVLPWAILLLNMATLILLIVWLSIKKISKPFAIFTFVLLVAILPFSLPIMYYHISNVLIILLELLIITPPILFFIKYINEKK